MLWYGTERGNETTHRIHLLARSSGDGLGLGVAPFVLGLCVALFVLGLAALDVLDRGDEIRFPLGLARAPLKGSEPRIEILQSR